MGCHAVPAQVAVGHVVREQAAQCRAVTVRIWARWPLKCFLFFE
jgi:hypothetical protein